MVVLQFSLNKASLTEECSFVSIHNILEYSLGLKIPDLDRVTIGCVDWEGDWCCGWRIGKEDVDILVEVMGSASFKGIVCVLWLGNDWPFKMVWESEGKDDGFKLELF